MVHQVISSTTYTYTYLMLQSENQGVKYDASTRPPNLTQHPATLIFDLKTPKVDHFMPFPCGPLMPFASKLVHSFSKHRVHKLGDGRTEERTD